MPETRRNVLAGIGATLAVGAGATQVFGQSNGDGIDVKEVNYEGEYVVFVNNSDSDIDVSGYTVAFEYSDDSYNQRRTLPDGTTINANSTLKVATGAKDVSGAVIVNDPYEGEVLNNDGNDVVALLDTDDNVVVTSEDNTSTTTTTTETETITTEDGGDDDTTTTVDDSDDTTTTTTTTTEDDSSDDSGETTSDSSESDSGNGSDSSSDESENTDDSSEESSSDEDC